MAPNSLKSPCRKPISRTASPHKRRVLLSLYMMLTAVALAVGLAPAPLLAEEQVATPDAVGSVVEATSATSFEGEQGVASTSGANEAAEGSSNESTETAAAAADAALDAAETPGAALTAQATDEDVIALAAQAKNTDQILAGDRFVGEVHLVRSQSSDDLDFSISDNGKLVIDSGVTL